MCGLAEVPWCAPERRQVRMKDHGATSPQQTELDVTESAPGTTAIDGARRTNRHVRTLIVIATCCVLVIGVAVAITVAKMSSAPTYPIRPTQYVRFVGDHEIDAPGSYAEIDQFALSIGRQPNLVSYYKNWLLPFQPSFAALAAKHGALTLAQMDPDGISLASIAAGRYDTYLRSYAAAVRAFGGPVIISFGHEMNGNWYSWGSQHTSPAVFVRAWRHIVNMFRQVGAKNVIWLWTVNVVDKNNEIPNPSPWWPGKSYVTWVGIDGYFYLQSQNFAQLFGPTIVDIRELTNAPILIAETGAASTTDQASKIDEIFSGVRTYGLLGFVWFDENIQGRAWRIASPAAFNALRRDAEAFMRPPAKTAPASPSSANSSP
jgi:mannan endo-1,4-beta-mannosidase